MSLQPVAGGELVTGDRQQQAVFYAAAFLAQYGGRTRQTYETDLRQWWDWCTQRQVDHVDVTRAHVQVWIRELEQAGRAPSTIARKLSAVGGFYRYLVDEEQLRRSPVASVRRPKVSDESPRFGLSRDELHLLLEQAAAGPASEHALVLLLALNGLRVSEACGARVGDLSEQRGHHLLAVLRKGGKRAAVPLAPRTAEVVLALAHGRPADEPLLGYDRFQAHRVVRRLVDAAGITTHISPHSLRHTFVTLSLDAGVQLRDVQDAAGHADPRTTRRYDRGRDALDRHATYALSSFLEEATEPTA